PRSGRPCRWSPGFSRLSAATPAKAGTPTPRRHPFRNSLSRARSLNLRGVYQTFSDRVCAGGRPGGLLLIPGNGLRQPLPEPGRRLEPEGVPRATRIEAPPRLPVRPGRVPPDLSPESAEVTDQLDQRADRDLLSGPDVDGLRAVVALGG